MSSTEHQPWEQLPQESGPAYRAFLAYRDLGSGRTLGKATRAIAGANGRGEAANGRGEAGPGRPKGGAQAGAAKSLDASSSIRRWAKQFRWEERVAAYDHHLEQARDRARTKAVEGKELKRAKQLQRQEEETLVAAEQLKLKAFQMLQWGLEVVTKETRTVDADGRTIHIHQTIEPAGWRTRDAALFLKAARELEDTVFFPDRGRAAAAVAAPMTPTERSDREGAAQRLGAWRAEMQRHMVTMPTSPPGAAAPDPPEEEPHGGGGGGGRNGAPTRAR